MYARQTGRQLRLYIELRAKLAEALSYYSCIQSMAKGESVSECKFAVILY